jgi:voltage-gated potassium channel
VVIPTAESAGRMLGLSIFAPAAGEVIEDLLEPVAGLQITEREVRPEDVGLAPSRLQARGEIVLTVIRNGVSHRFDSGGVKVFQPGDRIVVIKANAEQPEALSRRSRARRAVAPDLTGSDDRSRLPPGAESGRTREPQEPAPTSIRPPIRDLR